MRNIVLQGRILLAFLVFSSVCGCGDVSDLPGDEPPRKKPVMIDEAGPRKDRPRKNKKKKKKTSKEERKARREAKRRKYAKQLMERMRAVDETLPPAERKIAVGLRDGLENEDLSAVAKFAVLAGESGNVEIRAQAVDALNWFGERALSNLTGFLNDPDEEVASGARMAWEKGLSEIENESIQRAYLETAMPLIANREMLDSIAMNFNGMDDKGAAVESLVKIIESGNSDGSAVAKETYEFITGEKWSDKASALKWASENCPEPEPEE